MHLRQTHRRLDFASALPLLIHSSSLSRRLVPWCPWQPCQVWLSQADSASDLCVVSFTDVLLGGWVTAVMVECGSCLPCCSRTHHGRSRPVSWVHTPAGCVRLNSAVAQGLPDSRVAGERVGGCLQLTLSWALSAGSSGALDGRFPCGWFSPGPAFSRGLALGSRLPPGSVDQQGRRWSGTAFPAAPEGQSVFAPWFAGRSLLFALLFP